MSNAKTDTMSNRYYSFGIILFLPILFKNTVDKRDDKAIKWAKVMKEFFLDVTK